MFPSRTAFLAFSSAWTIALLLAGARAEEPWRPVGLGGSGGLFGLAIAPVDARLMMVNSDMSAAYTSRDAGQTWRQIHAGMLQGYTGCSPVFHPTIGDRVYAVHGATGELRVSDDAGTTWRALLKGRPPWRDRIGFLYVALDHPDTLFVGAGAEAYVSRNAGATWQRCAGVTGKLLGVAAHRKYTFIATTAGVYRSPELAEGYTPCGTGLPKGALKSFSGGVNRQVSRLYAAVECSLVDGRLTGGVYSSEDAGATWHSCMAGGLNVQTKRADQWAHGDLPQYPFIATTDKDPLWVYAFCTGTSYWPPNHATVYRSDDGGKTWAAVLFSDPRFARLNLYNVADDYVTRQWGQREQSVPYSMAIGGDPNVVALCASAWLLRTDDGGRHWRVCHTGPAKPTKAGTPTDRDPAKTELSWECNGLVVTSTWNYYIDPHEPARHYICYTDIGLARSLDGGQTWIWSGTALPWRNTVYELAFDPAVPGRIWGAMSETHDIPNANIITGHHRVRMQGGVARSDDFGASWQRMDLPAAPALSVVLDSTSPADRRVLYASLFEKGVYKSSDGGKTWAPANKGLGHPQNMRCCKLSRSRDGTLFVLVTAKRGTGGEYLSDGVGLYRSTDAAATWSKITESLPLHWLKDFTVKPDDPRTILLSACDVRGHEEEGGLYRTRDGGRSWSKLVQKGREHFGAFYHPKHPGWIYMTLTEGAREAGLYLSRDDGATWAPFTALPFRNIQRVTFDPARPGEILLTTFGSSVLRGPAEPIASTGGSN
jgi:photosystem II stability/assembly factor-like uncharacterized protein